MPSSEPVASEPAPSTTQATEPESTEPESTEPPTEDSQVLYYPEQCAQSYVVDLCRDEYTLSSGEEYCFALPYICLPGAEIEAINCEIQEVYHYEDWILEGRDSGSAWARDYTWHVNGDILTLLIYFPNAEYVQDNSYRVYNIRISTRSLVTEDDILEAAGVTREAYDNTLPVLAANALFEILAGDARREYLEENRRGELCDLFVATTGELLESAVPYLDENGTLCIRIIVRTPIGSESTQMLVAYDADTVPSPYYQLCLDYLENN